VWKEFFIFFFLRANFFPSPSSSLYPNGNDELISMLTTWGLTGNKKYERETAPSVERLQQIATAVKLKIILVVVYQFAIIVVLFLIVKFDAGRVSWVGRPH